MFPCLSVPYRAKGCSEEDANGSVNEMSCLTGRVNAAVYLSLCSFKQTQTRDGNKEACWERRGAVTWGHALLRNNRSSYTIMKHSSPFMPQLHSSPILPIYHHICSVNYSTVVSSSSFSSSSSTICPSPTF